MNAHEARIGDVLGAAIGAIEPAKPHEDVNNQTDKEPHLTGWEPVDLGPYLDGSYQPPKPALLERTDGVMGIYPGTTSDIHGPSGSGKSWLALFMAQQQIEAGRPVVYVDLESTPGRIVERLQLMGCTNDGIGERFSYLPLGRPLLTRSVSDRDRRVATVDRDYVGDWIATRKPSLVVIDGLTEIYAAHGLNPRDESDVSTWSRVVLDPIANRGPAVVLIDHTPHDANRAIGSQHKRSVLTGVSFSVNATKPFGVGKTGRSVIKVATKDRNGEVLRHTNERSEWGVLHLESDESTRAIRARIWPPDTNGEGATIRPVDVMRRISDVLIGGPDRGFSFRTLRNEVGKREDTVKYAVELLENDGYIEIVKGDRNAHFHRSLRPYDPEKDPNVPVHAR